jgi:S1-C subfamily serine protease
MTDFYAELDRRSLCVFLEILKDGSSKPFGTGCVFMKRDLVLTARHVLEGIDEQRPIFIANGSEGGRLIGANPKLVFSHPDVDLALVRVSLEELQINYPLFPGHFPLNKRVGAIAFGYRRDLSDASKRSWTLAAHEVADFEPQNWERYSGFKEFVLQFDAPWMEPGCSGGPVITLGGGVVAVLTEAFSSDASDTSQPAVKTSGRATSIYPILDLFRSPFD